jgi:hypothetical protein
MAMDIHSQVSSSSTTEALKLLGSRAGSPTTPVVRHGIRTEISNLGLNVEAISGHQRFEDGRFLTLVDLEQLT